MELDQIISFLKPLEVIGNRSRPIKRVIQFDPSNQDPDIICWINEKNLAKASSLSQGVLICPVSLNKEALNTNCTYLLIDNPRQAFQRLLAHFFVKKPLQGIISPSAIIGQNVSIGKNTSIGHHTVIEDNCIIGDNVVIMHNNAILENTVIHSNVTIGSNNTIGGIGFGYEKNEEGHYELMPHIGNVVIEEFVEVGNNTCIDRAVLGSTLLKKHCKIDNLVHIAHGVIVGENSLVIAHAIIGGSSVIGKNVWVAPNASVINKVSIGDNSTIGLAAVVVKDVEANTVVVGNPAKPLIKNK
ncbi:MAG: UDP-3-O-(3-hydroxymyristoyl)glucosamine N-acyltransferase [Bacteroidetes bacterium]|nr:UDP-3-O-(3-hydroxymyristoyl)glucosamine N-acyltransferase [Bacteroidota bacterium]